MAELEIAGTAALGGCVGDQEKSRMGFKKDGGVSCLVHRGTERYENGGEAFVSTLFYAVACSLEGSAAWYPFRCE
jgi:hypothetical protein